MCHCTGKRTTGPQVSHWTCPDCGAVASGRHGCRGLPESTQTGMAGVAAVLSEADRLAEQAGNGPEVYGWTCGACGQFITAGREHRCVPTSWGVPLAECPSCHAPLDWSAQLQAALDRAQAAEGRTERAERIAQAARAYVQPPDGDPELQILWEALKAAVEGDTGEGGSQ